MFAGAITLFMLGILMLFASGLGVPLAVPGLVAMIAAAVVFVAGALHAQKHSER